MRSKKFVDDDLVVVPSDSENEEQQEDTTAGQAFWIVPDEDDDEDKIIVPKLQSSSSSSSVGESFKTTTTATGTTTASTPSDQVIVPQRKVEQLRVTVVPADKHQHEFRDLMSLYNHNKILQAIGVALFVSIFCNFYLLSRVYSLQLAAYRLEDSNQRLETANMLFEDANHRLEEANKLLEEQLGRAEAAIQERELDEKFALGQYFGGSSSSKYEASLFDNCWIKAKVQLGDCAENKWNDWSSTLTTGYEQLWKSIYPEEGYEEAAGAASSMETEQGE